MDKDTLDDVNRDKDDQASLDRFNKWKASEEYANAVQLKYEALLADPGMIDEAIDPAACLTIASFMMRGMRMELGYEVDAMVHSYLHKMAIDQVEENYS